MGRWDKVQINVSQQLKSSIGTTRDYEVDTTVNVEGNSNKFLGKIRLLRTDRGILARGAISSEIILYCSRCLSSFNYPVTLNIEEEYFPTMDIITGTTIPLPEEPGSFTIDQHNMLDLSEAIRQYTLLAVPIKPLCQPECAGLCPTCGTNLNNSTCDCPANPVDPRWSELSKLVLTDTESSTDN